MLKIRFDGESKAIRITQMLLSALDWLRYTKSFQESRG